MKNKFPLTLVNCFCIEADNSGNPAAVIIDYQANSIEKLTIAAELNLPVTVFVSDSKSETPLIEYFYPNRKMPLCLHGTLAAASVLLKLRHDSSIKLKTEEGDTLSIINTDPGYLQVEVSSQNTVKTEVATDTIKEMLSIADADIAPNLPLTIASVGSPKLLIPVISSSTLNNLKPNFSFIEEWSIRNNINGIYVYAQDANLQYTARGFNPKTGHNEDAATGVAAAALSLALEKSIVVYQGASLGKSCKIIVNYNSPHSIWVGGVEKIASSNFNGTQ